MRLSSDQIEGLFELEREVYHFPVRIQVTAGYGCTVYEVFDKDTRLLGKIPLRRDILKEGLLEVTHI